MFIFKFQVSSQFSYPRLPLILKNVKKRSPLCEPDLKSNSIRVLAQLIRYFTYLHVYNVEWKVVHFLSFSFFFVYDFLTHLSLSNKLSIPGNAKKKMKYNTNQENGWMTYPAEIEP